MPTGNTRLRVNWRGKLILQVEVRFRTWDSLEQYHTCWRDATMEDISVCGTM